MKDNWKEFAEDAMRILGPEGDNENVNKTFELWESGFNRGQAEVTRLRSRIKELEEGIEKHKKETNTVWEKPWDTELYKLILYNPAPAR